MDREAGRAVSPLGVVWWLGTGTGNLGRETGRVVHTPDVAQGWQLGNPPCYYFRNAFLHPGMVGAESSIHWFPPDRVTTR